VTLPGKGWRAYDPNVESVFQPGHLLREARRQRNLPDQPVPPIGVLDPDGDLVAYLRRNGRARPSPGWACYHTVLDEFELPDGTGAGVVGCAVGAPFAVLVAEQLFASGCRLLVSVTSAGRIADLGEPPYAVLIDGALRDEGTSAHYLPEGAGPFVSAPDRRLLDRVQARLLRDAVPLHRGPTWTTDAPYRETADAIAAAPAPGSRRALRLRHREPPAGGLLRPRHEHHGPAGRPRFREGRGRRRARRPAPHLGRGRCVPTRDRTGLGAPVRRGRPRRTAPASA